MRLEIELQEVDPGRPLYRFMGPMATKDDRVVGVSYSVLDGVVYLDVDDGTIYALDMRDVAGALLREVGAPTPPPEGEELRAIAWPITLEMPDGEEKHYGSRDQFREACAEGWIPASDLEAATVQDAAGETYRLRRLNQTGHEHPTWLFEEA